MEEIDIPVLGGRPRGGRAGRSRLDGKDVGGPIDTAGALGGGGP
jgi:hypothetical protein